MTVRLYIPVYSLTLIVSAFLLFSVQPLIGKMILPLLGGSPSVWNTAMVFFQAMLLAGYAYAHGIVRLMDIRLQAGFHILLLGLFAFALPIAIPVGWEPPLTGDPAFWQLAMMCVAIGGPFFVLAASAPLLQYWFSHSNHSQAHNPYFLYAASNLGSMTALLTYPVLVEPFIAVPLQINGWSGGYIALILLTLVAAIMVLPHYQKEKTSKAVHKDHPGWKKRLQWIFFAFIPSSLMLGVTTYITTDVASLPLIWILPLAMYLGSFIIAFMRPQHAFEQLQKFLYILYVFLVLGVIWLLITKVVTSSIHTLLLHLVLFFICALICHLALADKRPGTNRLTEFYLMIAIGGVLGGIFNALIAPVIFVIPLEYPLVLGLVAFVGTQNFKTFIIGLRKSITLRKESGFDLWLIAVLLSLTVAAFLIPPGEYKAPIASILCFALLICMNRRWVFSLTVTATLLLHPGFYWKDLSLLIHTQRNYFGVLRIFDYPEANYRSLSLGTTTQGAQYLAGRFRTMPLTYYHPSGPTGEIFTVLNYRSAATQKIAAIGLGVGSIACYEREGRSFDFYEINPEIVKIAENEELFTFLSECDSPYQTIIGDGRLKIALTADYSYDMIFLDAFSSDSIPVHLVTKEAFQLYFRKLKPGGFIAINLTNRFINLPPIISAIARDIGGEVLFRYIQPQADMPVYQFMEPALYAVVAKEKNPRMPFFRRFGWLQLDIPPTQKPWTDDYADIVTYLKF